MAAGTYPRSVAMGVRRRGKVGRALVPGKGKNGYYVMLYPNQLP